MISTKIIEKQWWVSDEFIIRYQRYYHKYNFYIGAHSLENICCNTIIYIIRHVRKQILPVQVVDYWYCTSSPMGVLAQYKNLIRSICTSQQGTSTALFLDARIYQDDDDNDKQLIAWYPLESSNALKKIKKTNVLQFTLNFKEQNFFLLFVSTCFWILTLILVFFFLFIFLSHFCWQII